MSQIVYHEAGHAVVSEILCPESVTLVCAYFRGGSKGGFTSYYNDRNTTPLHWRQSRVAASLGGMAAIEQTFGLYDAGNTDDLSQAFRDARVLVEDMCVCGFHLHHNGYQDSEHLWGEQEQAISSEVEKYYRKAKEVIACNKDFFEKIAAALIEKGLLTITDIKSIKESCKITPVAL
jgi:cell division protease FtsH